MIGLTVVAFVLTLVATTLSVTGVIDAEILALVAVALAAFTLSCVIASWLTWEPRRARELHKRASRSIDETPIDETPEEHRLVEGGSSAEGPRGWPW
jgi:type VI protein secretion system component VasK